MRLTVIAVAMALMFVPGHVDAQVPVLLVATPDPRNSRDYIPSYEDAKRRRDLRLSLNQREKEVLRLEDPPAPGSIAEVMELRKKAMLTPTPSPQPHQLPAQQELELRLAREKLELEYQRKKLELDRQNAAPKKPRTGEIVFEHVTTSTRRR